MRPMLRKVIRRGEKSNEIVLSYYTADEYSYNISMDFRTIFVEMPGVSPLKFWKELDDAYGGAKLKDILIKTVEDAASRPQFNLIIDEWLNYSYAEVSAKIGNVSANKMIKLLDSCCKSTNVGALFAYKSKEADTITFEGPKSDGIYKTLACLGREYLKV